jgi:hypothetical protein
MVFDKYIQQYFNNIVALSFIGGGNRSTRRKPPTCPMTLTNYHIMLYRVHFPMGEIRTHTFNGKYKTERHDIIEILLNVFVKHHNTRKIYVP